jgi:Cell Wall Hydrolase
MSRAVAMWLALCAAGVDLQLAGAAHVYRIDELAEREVPAEFQGLENIGVACIALAVFAEAPRASWLGRALVAQVIVNRQAVQQDACDVVDDQRQFPTLAAWPFPRRPWADDPQRWAAALDIARQVSVGDLPLPPRCVPAMAFQRAAQLQPPLTLCEADGFVFTAGAATPPAAVAAGLVP